MPPSKYIFHRIHEINSEDLGNVLVCQVKTGHLYKNYCHLHAKKCALGPAVASGGGIKQIQYIYDVHRDTEHTAEPLKNTHTIRL